jgi:hypothetical protein
VDFKWNGPLIFPVSIKNSAKMIELPSTNYARCTLPCKLYIHYVLCKFYIYYTIIKSNSDKIGVLRMDI